MISIGLNCIGKISSSLERCCCLVQAFMSLFRRSSPKERVDISDNLTLEAIRRSLISQEDSIIFSLLERAQYCYNGDTYDPNAFSMDGFSGSLVEYLVKETERLHAQVLEHSKRRNKERLRQMMCVFD